MILLSFSNSDEIFVNFDSYSSNFFFDPSYSDWVTPELLLNLWISADKRITFYSSYWQRFLYLDSYSNFLFNSSFSLQTIFNSLFNLETVLADNLKLSWASLTYSPKAVFSDISFWIRCLYVYDSWLLALILSLYSFNSRVSLAWVALERRKLSWADDNSSPKLVFSEISFSILCLILSFSVLFWSISFLYSEIYFIILAFWLAESLKFYWACLISSSIEVFSLTNRIILAWRLPMDWFISLISSIFFLKLVT